MSAKKKEGESLGGIFDNFGEFLNSLVKTDEKKGEKRPEIKPEHLEEFRKYFRAGDNPELKKLAAGLMLQWFKKDLTNEELGIMLYSPDRDIQISAAEEILDRPITSIDTLKKVLSLDEPVLKIKFQHLLDLAKKQ